VKRFHPGLFFEYEAKSTHKKEKPKPTWLEPSYLPNYDKSLAFDPPTFQGAELWESTYETLVFDIETYPNYFLIAFKSIDSGKCVYFEKTDTQELDCKSVKWILENYRVISFNGRSFDMPIAALACAGASLKVICDAVKDIIVYGKRGHEVMRDRKVKAIKANHIDLIEVCPLSGSLKVYGARLHTKQLADLPFPPENKLTNEQKLIVLWYCFNDLQCTQDIFNFLKQDIELREVMGEQYSVDLRSKSDAQIAETVIINEVHRLNGTRPVKQELPSFYACKYDPPAYLNFKTPSLQNLFEKIKQASFQLDDKGYVALPEELEKCVFTINRTTYKFAAGGLHSQESGVSQFADEQNVLIDRDFVSFYPFIILNNELYPEQLGRAFLEVYRTIVEKRLLAKKNKDKRTADSLKITINGSFGKFGNYYSLLYSPKLLIQVTITGQLTLLYLIEKIELAAIPVVSANTDGIVIKCPIDRQDELNAIIKQLELETNLETEETRYFCTCAISVNEYMAVQTDLKCKGKGKRLGRGITKLFKNPDKSICITAIENLLSKSIPIEKTIRECNDIREFINVRAAKGGACKDGEFLGKVVRYYYSTETDTPIVTAKSGNMVAETMGARPCMEIPDRFPHDVDFEHYIRLTKKMLDEMGLKF